MLREATKKKPFFTTPKFHNNFCKILTSKMDVSGPGEFEELLNEGYGQI